LKVLLIQPDFQRQDSSSEQLSSHLLPSYSLVLLSQILEKAGHKTKVLDGFSNWVITGKGKENDLSKGLKTILEKESFDLVGISVYTPLRKEALQLAKLASDLAPGSKIVMGGPHPTRLWQSMFKKNKELIDFILLGGADHSLLALVESLEDKDRARTEIPGLVWLDEEGEVIAGGRPVFNIDLEDQAPVRFDGYLAGIGNEKVDRAYLVTTRGCKFHCNFCSQLWKKALLHPAARAVEEARHLVEDLDVSELVFYDDCLGLDPRHSAEVFKGISQFKRKARLIGITHIQLLNPLWLNPFREAGGEALLLGLESGSLKQRRKMNKHIEDKEICQGVELLRKMGFKLGIYTMVGFPNEEPAQLFSTMRLLEKISPEQVIATVYDLKPGDMMIEWGIKALMLQEIDYLNQDRRIINYMTEDELEDAVGIADYLETRFTAQTLLKDHDPPWWILGYDLAKREQLRKKAGEILSKCQN